MTPKISRIFIGFFLVAYAIGLTFCSHETPIEIISVPSNMVTKSIETRFTSSLISSINTESPQKTSDILDETTMISQGPKLLKATPSLTLTLTPTAACPSWVSTNQDYSRSLWENMSRPRKPDDYIGFQYFSLPPSLKLNQGSLILDSDCDYGTTWESGCDDFGITWVNDGIVDMLWFEELICRDWDRPIFEVFDVIVLPVVSQNDMLIFGGNGDCYMKGITDPELIVIAEIEITGHLTNIKQAWRANRKTEHFEELPTEGISCVVVISE